MGGETGAVESGWTVDTIKVLLQQQIEDLSRHVTAQHNDMQGMLHERYETQTKAVDAAFLAQQTAMQTALTAAERAVQTALLSAEKAVGKAENAAEKRFESVNEFRAQLADQAATFMSRDESHSIHTLLETRISAITEATVTEGARLRERLNALELRLTSRLDRDQGVTEGAAGQVTSKRSENTLLVGVIGAVCFVVSIAVTIVLATHG